MLGYGPIPRDDGTRIHLCTLTAKASRPSARFSRVFTFNLGCSARHGFGIFRRRQEPTSSFSLLFGSHARLCLCVCVLLPQLEKGGSSRRKISLFTVFLRVPHLHDAWWWRRRRPTPCGMGVGWLAGNSTSTRCLSVCHFFTAQSYDTREYTVWSSSDSCQVREENSIFRDWGFFHNIWGVLITGIWFTW